MSKKARSETRVKTKRTISVLAKSVRKLLKDELVDAKQVQVLIRSGYNARFHADLAAKVTEDSSAIDRARWICKAMKIPLKKAKNGTTSPESPSTSSSNSSPYQAKTPLNPAAVKIVKYYPKSGKSTTSRGLDSEDSEDDKEPSIKFLVRRKRNTKSMAPDENGILPFNSGMKSKRLKMLNNRSDMVDVGILSQLYLPHPKYRSDKGLPRVEEEEDKKYESALALVDLPFLLKNLKRRIMLKCPECSNDLYVAWGMVFHGGLLHFRCEAAQKGLLELDADSRQDLFDGIYSNADVVEGWKEACRRAGLCTYNEVLVTSPRLKTYKADIETLLGFGGEDDRATLACVLEADYCLAISCQLSFLSYSQYTSLSDNMLIGQRPLPEKVYYKLSKLLFGGDNIPKLWKEHTRVLKKVVRGVKRLFDTCKFLSMDTTFSQRRNANYSLTSIISVAHRLVYYAKVLDKKKCQVQAVALEAIASRMLVEEALVDKSNGIGADWKAICTDAHTENAKMFVEVFEEYLRGKAVEAEFFGFTDCGSDTFACLDQGSGVSGICGKHARERDIMGAKCRVKVDGDTVTVSSRQVLEFATDPESGACIGEKVYVVLDEDDMIMHCLDVWHVLKSVENGLRKRAEFLKDDLVLHSLHLVIIHVKNVLWQCVHGDNVDAAFYYWLRAGCSLGSLQSTTDGGIPPKLIRLVDEFIFGGNESLAAKVEKYRLEMEKNHAGCKCANGCSCGKLQVKIDYREKAARSKAHPPLDMKKISQLAPKVARTSGSESQFSFVHLNIRKRRHYAESHEGRCLFVNSVWNAKRISEILPIFDKKTGRVAEASALEGDALEVFNELLNSGVTVEEINTYLTLPGVHAYVTESIYKPEMFEDTFEYVNAYRSNVSP